MPKSITSKYKQLCLLFFWFCLSLNAQPTQASDLVSGTLEKTLQNRSVQQKILPFFQTPEQYPQRWQSIRLYFKHRFGIPDALSHELRAKIIVLHTTETESEASVYQNFSQGSEKLYLGGVWTHFSVDSEGKIRQYSPLDRLSKGQAGVNDQAIGIEILGFASSYRGRQRIKTGSIVTRYAQGQKTQLEAVADLTTTLQHLYHIPQERIYAHQDIGNLKHLTGQNPDYEGLKKSINDRVFLGEVPLLDHQGQPGQIYGYLQAYGRTDPGFDIMNIVKDLLIHNQHQ